MFIIYILCNIYCIQYTYIYIEYITNLANTKYNKYRSFCTLFFYLERTSNLTWTRMGGDLFWDDLQVKHHSFNHDQKFWRCSQQSCGPGGREVFPHRRLSDSCTYIYIQYIYTIYIYIYNIYIYIDVLSRAMLIGRKGFHRGALFDFFIARFLIPYPSF